MENPTTAEAVERFRSERDQLLSVGNRARERALELDVGDDTVPERKTTSNGHENGQPGG